MVLWGSADPAVSGQGQITAFSEYPANASREVMGATLTIYLITTNIPTT